MFSFLAMEVHEAVRDFQNQFHLLSRPVYVPPSILFHAILNIICGMEVSCNDFTGPMFNWYLTRIALRSCAGIPDFFV